MIPYSVIVCYRLVIIRAVNFKQKSAQRHRGLVERGAYAACQFQRIVVGPKMHEERTRLFIEHMAMYRSYLNVAGTQRSDQRIDLVTRHQKVAGDGCLAAAGRLEVDGVVASPTSSLPICTHS